MQRTSVVLASLLLSFVTNAGAGDTEDLIALDKKWGESTMKGDMSLSQKVLSDQVVSVTSEGVRGKKAEIAANEPAPAGARYEPTDYKVTFVSPDVAIMTHGTKGDDAHYSLHVWARKGGQWQIVATSITEMKDAD